MKKLVLFLGVSVLLSSCAFQIGTMSGNASISHSKFQVVDFAIGTSNSTKILGFGGVKRESLVLEAKRDLYTHYPLKRGQALSNITVDYCKKHFGLFSKTKVTLTAEIVDFNEKYDSALATKVSNMLKSDKLFEYKDFHINETVFVKNGNTYLEAQIIELQPLEVTIKINEKAKKEEMLNVKYSDLFRIKQNDEVNQPKYEANDIVKFYLPENNDITGKYSEVVGRIKCVGYDRNYIIQLTYNNMEFAKIVKESMILNKN